MKRTDIKELKGFQVHGVVFVDDSGEQAVGHCPWCSKGKFYVNRGNGLWDCKVCGLSGNFEQFLERRMEDYQDAVAINHLPELRSLWKDRSIRPATFRSWGVGWSGDFYAIPVRGNPSGRLTDIRRYYPDKKRSLATPGCRNSVIVPLENEWHNSRRLWLCEGEWDAMALFELMKRLKIREDVVGLPGAGVLPNRILELFIGKDIVVAYDNDGAGEQGRHRIAQRLEGTYRSIQYVDWPSSLPPGYDIRDFYREGIKEVGVSELWAGLGAFLKDYEPPKRMGKGKDGEIAPDKPEFKGEGLDPREVEKRFKKWLYMPSTECLDVLFGSVVANRIDGDPLWLFLVAPPGGMKTELLMSLTNAPGIVETSSLTRNALISGQNTPKGDPSLIPVLNENVLIIKDFTTILTMMQTVRDEILGILRDAYDGKVEKWYGNGVHRQYNSKFGIVAGVTPAIETLGNVSTVLGERFLRFRILGSGMVSAGRSRIKRAMRNTIHNSEMKEELGKVAVEVLSKDFIGEQEIPTVPEEIEDRIVGLASWIATLRGVVIRERYTRMVEFKPMVEIGTRLAKQLLKLALGISYYRGDTEVTERTYQTLCHVAQSTAPDRVEEVVQQLFIHIDSQHDECTTKDISEWTKLPLDTVRYLLQDMSLLKVVYPGKEKGNWKLHPGLFKTMRGLNLYEGRKKWTRGKDRKAVRRRKRT